MTDRLSASRSRAPRKDAAANREAILSSAGRVLNADPDAAIEAIAAAAGLSRRTLYGHFPSRDALVTEVLVRGARRVSASVQHVAHEDARVELALVGARLWTEVAAVRVMAQLAVRGPHARVVASSLAPVRRRILSITRRGVHEGSLRTDLAASRLARLIEGAALAVLDEATATGMSERSGHRLVMLAVLGTSGLDWRSAGDLIDTTPVLAYRPRAAS